MPASLTTNGVQFADGSTRSTAISISGANPSSNIKANISTAFTITNYDSYSSYNVSTTNGSVTQSGNTINYVPITEGANTGSFIVNNRTIGSFNVDRFIPNARTSTSYASYNTVAIAPGVTFSSRSFTSVNLGSGSRKVIVVCYNGAGTITTLSSATIAGVSATISQTLYGSSWQQIAILRATTASTTGTVTLNFASPLNTAGGGTYATISIAAYSDTRTNADTYQISQSASPSVSSITCNANNRLDGLTIGGLFSTNGTSVTGLSINQPNANVTINVTPQNILYSNVNTYDTFTFFNTITDYSFNVSANVALYQHLTSITLY